MRRQPSHSRDSRPLRPVTNESSISHVNIASNLRARIVEVGQRLESVCLRVAVHNMLHNVRIVLPVDRLQIVARHYVDVPVACRIREKHYLLAVARFEQRFHCLFEVLF